MELELDLERCTVKANFLLFGNICGGDDAGYGAICCHGVPHQMQQLMVSPICPNFSSNVFEKNTIKKRK